MVGWHHGLNGHDFEQTPRDGEGQGSLVCCSPWGHKELDTITEQQQQNISDAGGFSFVPSRALGTIILWGHLWEGCLAMAREAPVTAGVL